MIIFWYIIAINLFQTSWYFDFIHWLEKNQGACPYKKYWGISCPGCGMQTAIINLLKGNIWQSIIDYPALIPLTLTILTFILHLIFKFKYGAAIIKYLFIFTVVLIVG
ncbi:MAG TPA: DUF2752 domain-containing protein, partial [Bacteroidales bacterium]|nr:DUF2752 domain-containing protein [Bacteroidales bacterium]